MLNPARRRALDILHPEYTLEPEIFAHYMWPLSPSWTRPSRPGGAIRGKAATFLARLFRDGLVERHGGDSGDTLRYTLSPTGARARGSGLD